MPALKYFLNGEWYEAGSGPLAGGSVGWRAAVNFNGLVNPPVIRSAFNVESIERLQDGVWRIHFETPSPNANYLTLLAGRFNDFDGDNNSPMIAVYRHAGYGKRAAYVDISASQHFTNDYQNVENIDVLCFDAATFGAGTVVNIGGGGGAGGGNVADVPPANPDPMDDEFTGNALDPKWAFQFAGAPNPILAFVNGQIVFQDVNIRPISQNVPAGEWEFTCKFLYPAYVENYANFGFVFTNNVENYAKTYNINWGSGDLICFQIDKMGSYQGNVSGARMLLPSAYIYLRVKRYLDGGVMKLDFSASRDGVYYSPYMTFVETDYLPSGIGQIGIYGSNQNPAKVVWRAEWFRKTA